MPDIDDHPIVRLANQRAKVKHIPGGGIDGHAVGLASRRCFACAGGIGTPVENKGAVAGDFDEDWLAL